jgi:hypothetical protein
MKKWRTLLFILTGFALGLGIGVLIAWGVMPAQFVESTPASLRLDFKDEYRYMIASAYQSNGDLLRAQARLTTIGDMNPPVALGEQAQRMLADNTPLQMVQVLANLSEALQTIPTATDLPYTASPIAQTASPETSATPQDEILPSPTQATATFPVNSPEPQAAPSETDTPTPIPSPIPTLPARPKPTATASPGPAFELAQQTSLCEPSQPGLLQIYLSDAKGKPVAGVELVITWFGGEEHFFTGLKAEISSGYADTVLSENVEYDLILLATGTRVTGLRAAACTDASGSSYPGGIRLEFKQP